MSKRKGKKRPESASLRINREMRRKARTTATESNYLYHLKEYFREHPEILVVLYGRVSGREQNRRGNLINQESILQEVLRKLGVPVIGYFQEVSSGWILDEDRFGLVNAVEMAKEHDAVIVAFAADRFLRNEYYQSTHPEITPTIREYEKLMKLVKGVPLLTYLHPDTLHNKITGMRSRLGQELKRNKGGRPRKIEPGYKKRWKKGKYDEVRRLYEKGLSYSDINWYTDVPKSTIRDWTVGMF